MAVLRDEGGKMNPGQQAPARAGEVNALLGRGSEFEGKLSFEGTVRIDGKFTGEVQSDGTLIIGEGAKVKAEVIVDTVIVQGDMIGNIRAKTAVELHAPGRLRGNIQTAGLVVQKGAVFDGSCVMEGREGGERRSGPPNIPIPGQ
ncbi:MAG: polymer-forming cytoskeletal protein [Deltaproteobacteria bacterium]|nr:polymer-forming cytoskeletal protein [Deltaproteobacteria bacterium]